MISPLLRSSVRYFARHKWLFALSILGVAVGVAVVVSIDVANVSAKRAFELSSATVAGNATHQIRGNSSGLPEQTYVNLRVRDGIDYIAPIVSGYAAIPSHPAYTMEILGVDPIADAPFRPFVGGVGAPGGYDLGAFIGPGMGAIMSERRASQFGVGVGDSLDVSVDGIRAQLKLVNLIVPNDERSAEAIDNLLIVDIGTAQALTGTAGFLSRIDLIIGDNAEGEQELRRIQQLLPAGVEIVRSETRSAMLMQMTRAFEMNLSALSLLALIVGMFLTYNTIAFSVVQRRQMIGRMRAIGATRRDIIEQILGEALLVGLVGTSIGLLLGLVLGKGLVSLVSRTINDLYFVVTVRDISVSPSIIIKGAVLGLIATILSALAPALSATSGDASTVLRRSTFEGALRRRTAAMSVIGAVVVASAYVVLATVSLGIVGSYIWIGIGLLGFVLMVPGFTVAAIRGIRPVLARLAGVVGRMAAGGIVSTLSRTSIAIAALTVAVAATIGVGVMVSSFRTTVVSWLDDILQADIYIQAPGQLSRGATSRIKPAVLDLVRATPGVASSYSVRQIEVSSSLGPTNLTAIEVGEESRERFKFKDGDSEQSVSRLSMPNQVLVSEPYAYRHRVSLNDTFTIQTDRGETTVTIAGIYYDYGSDQGVVLIERNNYDSLFADPFHSGVAVYAESEADIRELMLQIRQRTSSEQQLVVRSNRDLREYSMQVFDQTFTITYVLRLLAVFVAFVGILSALMSLQMERAREFAVLRATGMTAGQLWKLVSLQTGLMGLLAAVLAIPLGLLLAMALVYVINQRAFGWTLQLDVSSGIILQAVLLSLFAAVLAGLIPAWKMSRANAAEALREE